MTLAICVKCGSFKHGAFNTCRECSYCPITDDHTDVDLAYSLAFTDHYFTKERLQQISASMKSGLPRPELPTDQEQEVLQAIKDPQFRKSIGLPDSQNSKD